MLTLTKPGIDEYAQTKTDPHDRLLEELMNETHRDMSLPQMLTGPIEGQFLKLMVKVTGARRVIEFGTFTGYSALSMAEGLPEDGELFTFDVDDECLAIAQKYFDKSEHGKKIKPIKGPAIESVKKLEGEFDLVFIDADKTNYKNYYEAVLPMLKKGGVILVDNVLWSGAVLDPKTESDRAIAEFNDHVCKDERVEQVLLTVRDGVFFIRKL